MSTRPSYVPPTYEDLQPKYEPKETLESHLLLVHIPDGFAREDIGAKVEFDFGRVRVFGERPLGNNRSSRFNLVHHVPASCDINRIKGKFEGGIVTITMPKKVISKELPKEEQLEANEQEAPKPPVQETEPSPEKDQEGIPPQSTNGDDKEKTTDAEVKDQKGQEGISDQDSKSTVEGEGHADHETSTPTEATEDSRPQNGQEEIPQKTDAKLQTEEKFARQTDENGEKQSFGKEETKEDTEKTLESGKPTEKAVVEDSTAEKERQEESFVPKTPVKEKEKEINGKSGDSGEGIYGKGRTESKGKGILEAASTTQAVTSPAKWFNEDDKQKLIYIGAAVIVVALGVYVSYKFRSSPRT